MLGVRAAGRLWQPFQAHRQNGAKTAMNVIGCTAPVGRSARPVSSIPVTSPGAFAWDGGVESIHLYSVKWHNQLGPIFRDPDMGAIFLSDPVLVDKVVGRGERYPKLFVPAAWTLHARIYGEQRGLLFREGEEWWQARRMVNPFLLKNTALASMHSVLNEDIENFIQVFQRGKTTLEEIDLYRWLVESMIRIFIGDNFESSEKSIPEIAEQVVFDARGIFDSTAALMLVNVDEAAKSESADWVKFCGHTNSIFSMLKSLIRDAGDNLGGVAGNLIKGGMNRDEIEKIVADLMLGGMDTTAITSNWIIYTLASNQSVQDQVRAEVQRVCGQQRSSSELTAELHITRGLLKEVMRLYPVAPFLTRILSQPIDLENHHLPSGSFIAISLFVMGQNPDIFPDPGQIIPDRWIRNSNDARTRHIMALSALPFGHGVRMCIGRRLAELQMLLLVSRLVQDYRVSTVDTAEYITRMVGIPRVNPRIQIQPLH